MVVTSLVVDGATTLYQVAAQQYGDTSQFISILQNNYLPSPFIIQPLEIALEQNPPNNDGAPQQPTPGGVSVPTIATYPYTTTTYQGVTTLQYPTGNIVSVTAGVGNKAGVTPPTIQILEVSFTVTVEFLQPTNCVAVWTQPNALPTLMCRVEIMNLTGDQWQIVGVTNQMQLQVTGLTPNTSYDIHVVPFNILGDSVLIPPITTFLTPVFQTGG